MEQRFIEAGVESAKEMRKLNPEHKFPDNLEEIMTNVGYNWFIADMSDDYSRTLGEQHALRKELHELLGEDIKYPYRYR